MSALSTYCRVTVIGSSINLLEQSRNADTDFCTLLVAHAHPIRSSTLGARPVAPVPRAKTRRRDVHVQTQSLSECECGSGRKCLDLHMHAFVSAPTHAYTLITIILHDTHAYTLTIILTLTHI